MDGDDYRALIFNSARDGNLRRLKIFLEDRDSAWLQKCFAASPNGVPPLVIAARNGHCTCVRYLLWKHADVSVRGSVSFDGETIHGAPALWAAAAAGHSDIVKVLVEEGHADVNQTTTSNSSPLRGACYDGHLRIVEYLLNNGADVELANRHGHTPLMIAAFKMHAEIVKLLLDHGADPLRTTAKGNTAMHDAAEAGSVEIVRMLLAAGAKNVKDDYQVTPLMSAALAGHENVVRLLSKVADSRETRDAMKLLGATLVDRKLDLRSAMDLWCEAVADGPSLQNRRPREIYDNLVEVDSFEEVQSLVGDPEAIRMQALIMRERILGEFHSETHYYIRYRGAVYYDLGQVDRCYQLWGYALSLQQKHLCALNPSTTSTITAFLDALMSTVNDGIINGNRNRVTRPFLLAMHTHVLNLLVKTISELERYGEGDQRFRNELLAGEDDEEKSMFFHMLISLQSILLVGRLSQHETKLAPVEGNANKFTYQKMVRRLVAVCRKLNLYPLHAACEDVGIAVTSRFPSRFVLMELIRAGVDVNARDSRGRTALHVILRGNNVRVSMVNLLLHCGADMFIRDVCGCTSFHLINRKIPHAKHGRYITLTGLAANALQRHRVPPNFRDFVPADLLPLLDTH